MKKTFKKAKILAGAVATSALLLTGCGDSEDFVFTNTVPPVAINAPVAVNDAYGALGNATVTFTAANGVLANDTLNGAVIDSFDAVGNQNGTLVLNNDGSLSYTPVFGFVGSETFAYTLRNARGSSTATITFTSTGSGFFVNNQAADGGNGSQAAPFDTLAEAVAAANTGDTVFVFRGDGTANNQSGPITLDPGVNLVGEGQGLVVAQTIVPQGQRPVITGPVTLLGNNTVSGLQIVDSATDGIIADGVSNITINNNLIESSADEHLDLDDIGGTLNITNNTFTNNDVDDTDYIDLISEASGTVNIIGNTFTEDNTLNANDAIDIEFLGSAVVAVNIQDNDFTGSSDLSQTFENAIDVSARDDSSLTVDISGNNCTNAGEDTIGVDCDQNATMTGSIALNVINGSQADGIEVSSGVAGPVISLSGNAISNSGISGIDIVAVNEGASEDTGLNPVITIEGNNIETSPVGIELETDTALTDTYVRLLISNNNISATSASILQRLSNEGIVCTEISGNTLTGNVVFEDALGFMRIFVRRFDELATDNNITGTVTDTDGDSVTDNGENSCPADAPNIF